MVHTTTDNTHACTVMDGANADPSNPRPAVWVVYCLTCGPIAEHDYLAAAQDRAKVHGARPDLGTLYRATH